MGPDDTWEVTEEMKATVKLAIQLQELRLEAMQQELGNACPKIEKFLLKIYQQMLEEMS